MCPFENPKEKYQNSCRICIVPGTDERQLNSMFMTTINAIYDNNQSIQLSEMFTACTSISLYPEDELPYLICAKCQGNLEAAYEFRLQCLRTDLEIRQAYNFFKDAPCSPTTSATTTTNNIEHNKQRSPEPNQIKIKEESNDVELKIETDHAQDSDYNPASNDIDTENEKSQDSDDSEMSLKRLKLELSSKNRIKCELCGKKFKKKNALKNHAVMYHNVEKPFECVICKYRFSKEGALVKHQLKFKHGKVQKVLTDSDEDEKMNVPIYQLKTDTDNGNIDTQPNNLNESSVTENQNDEYQDEPMISQCDSALDSESKKQYKCEYCPKSFTRLNYLTRHVKIHSEFKSHECNLCGEKFALIAQLDDHVNMHKGVKPHVCPHCNKGYQKYCSLRDHIRRHTGETPFLCSECGKAFNNRSNLHQHVQRHTGIKPFACTDCPSRFICKAKLSAHMVTHTGIKAFVCDTCGSSFTKNWSLTTHKRIHTGERPYACELCEMR